jgi:hypothetical protein
MLASLGKEALSGKREILPPGVAMPLSDTLTAFAIKYKAFCRQMLSSFQGCRLKTGGRVS